MKTLVRLTESELNTLINNAAIRLVKDKLSGRLNEDVLGDNWHEAEEEDPFNNYEPFESQMDDGSHDWSGQGEEDIDPTFYDDPEWYRDDVIGGNYDPSDGDLYRGGW